ncbi:type I restriction-modification system subunit M [Janthinobacterium violaceinigrum]|uniref:site-specific DNA-methyltransferase (adenine-specific) n=1 Tax=Janthinobacterium violaceinigrum TaxID=2654252 RepID=A0A6I1HNJ2_9BURK|nr:class I SAM-dependent DNA methyltransferase [Janthinobacterium violaceinigrum]KAB8060085.1 N-6 DNA methylase [Janthinobacterium violaceinigrum]
MDYQELKLLEDDLWEAADQLRANSKLTASEYSMPVLGLIFLRHATTRFNDLLPEVLKAVPARATGALREDRLKLGFQSKAAIYLPESARYDYLAALPAGTNVGAAIRDAMIAIEDSVTDQKGQKLLEGALPKDYLGLEQDLLAELIKIFNRPALQTAKGDVFGRIYEYFLNQFAQSGAQEGGEFFTPPSLVRMIVNVIEPDHGMVLDPACGSAGMFVQTGHFIEEVCHKNTNDIDITFYGQEKADLNSKLARMNLAVHGLEGNIRIGNTFYEDHHQLLGTCDFVMANPPFNVDGVQVAKIKSQVGENQTGRLPFGLPGVAGKSKGKNNGDGETISNANSLWIQYFYSYLNASGRAGFVMASSASDAGNKDKEIRQKLVETGHVDVMMSIGPKFFYTRTLPCALWFFDKGKPDDLLDTVLMIDARNVYTVVSARSHVFTDEQLLNLSAITWLYRGEHEKFTALLASYQIRAGQYLSQLPERFASDEQQVNLLSQALRNFGQTTADAAIINTVRDRLGDEHCITDEAVEIYRTELIKLDKLAEGWGFALEAALAGIQPIQQAIAGLSPSSTFAERRSLQNQIETISPSLKAALAVLEVRHKCWLKVLDIAEKTLRARHWQNFAADVARNAKKALLPHDAKKREKPTLHDQGLEAIKRASYFIAQGHWLISRFPDGLYDDVPGLCKAVTKKEIEDSDYSLTPGRYVGVAHVSQSDDEGEAFIFRMKEIHADLAELNDLANILATKIQDVFAEMDE